MLTLLRLFITFRRKEPSVFLQHKKRRRKTSPRVQHTSKLKHTQDRGNIVVESPSTKLHLARRTEKKGGSGSKHKNETQYSGAEKLQTSITM